MSHTLANSLMLSCPFLWAGQCRRKAAGMSSLTHWRTSGGGCLYSVGPTNPHWELIGSRFFSIAHSFELLIPSVGVGGRYTAAEQLLHKTVPAQLSPAFHRMIHPVTLLGFVFYRLKLSLYSLLAFPYNLRQNMQLLRNGKWKSYYNSSDLALCGK